MRVLEILNEMEISKYGDFRDICVKSELMDNESLFGIYMENESYKIRTKLTNERKHIDMLFMIANHVFTVHHHINDTLQDMDYIHLLTYKMKNDFQYGIQKFFGKDKPNEYEGDDYEDILKKFHYSSLDMNPNEYITFLDSLNNMELMRVMKLVSYYRGYPDEALLFFDSSSETDSTKIYDIARLQRMINELYQFMDERGENLRSKNILNLCLNEYILDKREEKVLGLLRHYGYDFLDLPDSLFSKLFYSNMKEVMFNLILQKKVSIEKFRKTLLFSNGYQIENYDRVINCLFIPMHLLHKYNDEEKSIFSKMETNIRLLKMIAKKEFEKIPSFLDANKNFVFKIPTSFIAEMIYKDQIELVDRLFSQNIIDLNIFEVFHFTEIFLMYTSQNMFKMMITHIPFNKLFDMRFEDFNMAIIKELEFKKEYRRKYISNILPHSFQIDVKYQISSYLV
jgi:hypothetical protein